MQESTIDPAIMPQHLDLPGQSLDNFLAGDNEESWLLSDATVMIVDDEPIIAEVVQCLRAAGFKRFVTCHDASMAIDTLTREQPDLLLLDLVRPELNGFEILTSLKSDPMLSHIPVIMLTSPTDSQTRLETLKRGAADFLAKPAEAGELIIRLRNILTIKAYHDHFAKHTALLEHQVLMRTNCERPSNKSCTV